MFTFTQDSKEVVNMTGTGPKCQVFPTFSISIFTLGRPCLQSPSGPSYAKGVNMATPTTAGTWPPNFETKKM